MDNTEKVTPQKNLIRVKELRAIAGLTYRQINDWEAKGVIPKTREQNNQWRSFTPPQAFGLAVLAEIRRKIGVPLESLRWLGSVLMAENSKHLYQSVGQMMIAGVPAMLVTDLRKTFRIVNSIELGELMADRSFPPADTGALIMVKVNDMAKYVIELIGLKRDQFEMRPVDFEWKSARLAHGPEEEQILALIRSVKFDKVEIDLARGQVKLVTAEQTIPNATYQSILKQTSAAPFQTVEIVQQDGKITRARRKIRIKPAELKLGLGTRRRDPER